MERLRSLLSTTNLALRVIMETAIIAALGYWGFQQGGSTGAKILLAFAVPLFGFGFWGLVDFHQAGRWAEPLRLAQELLIAGLAALALLAVGERALGWALALLTVIHHALVYALGERLIQHKH